MPPSAEIEQASGRPRTMGCHPSQLRSCVGAAVRRSGCGTSRSSCGAARRVSRTTCSRRPRRRSSRRRRPSHDRTRTSQANMLLCTSAHPTAHLGGLSYITLGARPRRRRDRHPEAVRRPRAFQADGGGHDDAPHKEAAASRDRIVIDDAALMSAAHMETGLLRFQRPSLAAISTAVVRACMITVYHVGVTPGAGCPHRERRSRRRSPRRDPPTSVLTLSQLITSTA